MTNYERDKQNIMKWQKENIVKVSVGMSREEREEWQAYAKSKGVPLATLIRELMQKEMHT